MVVHPHGAEHHDRSDRHPHQLTLEQAPGALGLGDAGCRARRQHHDGAERSEERGGTEQGEKDRGAATDRAARTASVGSRPGRRVPPTRRALLNLLASGLSGGHRAASAVTARAKSSPRSP